MSAIFRKELRLLFRIKSTYIILAVLLSAIGLFTVIFAPMGGLQFIPVYLAPLTFALLPLVEIFAVQRQKRTAFEDVCLSAGISPTAMMLGQFGAHFTVFLIPVVLLLLLPPLLSTTGSIAFGSVYTSVFGYLLLVAFLLAIEQCILAWVAKDKWRILVAYAIPVVLYVYHFLTSLLPLEGVARALLTATNPVGLFYAFTYGRFPFADLIALLAGIALCLFGGILLCKKRRGDFTAPTCGKKGIVALSLALALTLILSMGTALVPARLMSPDVSGSETFEVVAEAKDYLRGLDKDVTLYYLVSGGARAADVDMQYFLEDLVALSAHLKLELVNTAKDSTLLERFGAENLSDQSLIVASGNRYQLLDQNDLYHYYNADLQTSLTPVQYAYYLSAYNNYLQTGSFGDYDQTAVAYGAQLYSSTTTVAYFDGCARLINAIHYVTSPLAPTAKLYASQGAMDSSLSAFLAASGYYFEEIGTLTDFANGCDLLIIHTPKSDISGEEAEALSAYLESGGKVFLVTSCIYNDLPNLHSVTQQFGLDVLQTKNIVCEQDKDYHYSAERSDCFLAHIAPCDMTAHFDGYFAVISAHAIKIAENAPAGINVFPLLYTGETSGCLMYEGGEIDTENPERLTVGAVAQKGDGTLVWLASADSASIVGYSMSSGGNFTLIREILDQLSQNTYESVSVSSTLMTTNTLTLGENAELILGILLIAVLPMALLVPGLIFLYKRKKR